MFQYVIIGTRCSNNYFHWSLESSHCQNEFPPVEVTKILKRSPGTSSMTPKLTGEGAEEEVKKALQSGLLLRILVTSTGGNSLK